MDKLVDSTRQERDPRASRQSSAPSFVGISGARRNPAAAVAIGGELRAVCEQERLTRIRGTSLRAGELPEEALRVALELAGVSADTVRAYTTAEEGVRIPTHLPSLRLDHHQCHAATAFLTSPFESSAILVCDRHSNPEVSVWRGDGVDLINQQWPWRSQGFASLFSECTEVFGFALGQEYRLEALARLDRKNESDRLKELFVFTDGSLRVDPDWKRKIAGWLQAGGERWTLEHGAHVAASFQRALGDALRALVISIRASLGVNRLCVGGGFFYNTYFNTLVSTECGLSEVFVPPNPGNPGIAAGAALAAGRQRTFGTAVTAFLGPEFGPEQIKRTLDNCKLSAEPLRQRELIGMCLEDLMAGRLVAWFHGRMEWGHRALGNRSILASPFSPYVLDNLNVFLKQRERHRAYGLSVLEEDGQRLFAGPPRSRWMEYDYTPRDLELFRHVMPAGASTLRVQTVDPGESLFRQLHVAFGKATGTPVLVNTSFNGFSEPIVCSPRDAIRVFYGTGIDVLVLDGFVIRK